MGIFVQAMVNELRLDSISVGDRRQDSISVGKIEFAKYAGNLRNIVVFLHGPGWSNIEDLRFSIGSMQ